MNNQLIDFKGQGYLEVASTDYALIADPLLNKGLAFTQQEREDFKLYGLIPPHQDNLSDQRKRAYMALQDKPTDLEKYIYLRSVQDTNETLFYSLLVEHITELMPIVYTPTVGLGCQQFSHIYRQHPRGIFIYYPDRDRISDILANPRFDHVEVIVVSDGERILGLGDQGAGGMGIPIGKLSLYSACAGIHPATTLPILLDTGTNNTDLFNDPLYVGWRHERVRGQQYDDFIDAFVQAVKKRFPHILLQWEDFAQQNASPILERYRDQLCTFNDDIQGTAAVTVGALLAAVRATGIPLREQRLVIAGAGSAGCGISELIVKAMMKDGLSESEARSRFYLIDRYGLLIEGMTGLMDFQKRFLQSRKAVEGWSCEDPNHISLKETVKNVHPTILIGASGQPGIFTEEIVRDMASHVDRPVIFPMSNPTNRAEAKPVDLMAWTNERAIIGTGSPFGEVTKNGQPFRVDQTNNAYIFPGMGLGAIAVKARRINDRMFMAAAQALADCSPTKHDPQANLLPSLAAIREVSYQVALAVANEAIASNLAEPCPLEELKTRIRNKMWTPAYLPYKKIPR
jgi:malate dehydrogenase (oxaloacetate-decarboxylating)